MTEKEERVAVIKEALEWEGTAHHPEARLKGVGCDCGTFPLEVYERVRLIPHVDLPKYSPQWHMHKDEPLYLDILKRFAHEVDKPGPGDILMIKYGRQAAHGAIVIEWPMIIHADVTEGVTRDNATKYIDRFAGFYSIWGKP